MSDLGFFTLSLALGTTTYSIVGLALGIRKGDEGLTAAGKRAIYASAVFLTLAVLALIYVLLARDFQVEYVASHTSSDLALPYTLSALWAGQEGSLLFWTWVLSVYGTALVLSGRRASQSLSSYSSLVVACVLAFFLVLVIFVNNPFQRLDFVPADGLGMNPLLQNPAMIWHPPVVYLGYVGFTVPFALTLAVLLSGRLNDPYVPLVRRWTLVSWLCLGVGTVLGAQWAYVELGWGGYWAWDPVENASLLPWLTSTALIHSLMMRRGRGALKVSHIVLVVATFALCIFGTFVTRSGMISSVHAFAVSPIGLYFLAFLIAVIVGSTVLTLRRRAGLKGEDGSESLVSRSTALWLTIVLLVAAMAAILLGTLFPLVSDLLNVALTTDYFNLSSALILGPLILLMGICPFTTWKGGDSRGLSRRLIAPLAGGLLMAALLLLLGLRDPLGVVAFSVCAFVTVGTLLQFYSGLRSSRRASGANLLSALVSMLRKQRSRYGGYVVHLGIVMITVGVVGSSAYKIEESITLDQGATHTVGGYTLRYEGFSYLPSVGKDVATATLAVYERDKQVKQVAVLRPEKQFFHSSQQPVSEVAIRSTLKEDLYLALTGWEDASQRIALEVIVSPLVVWIWIGGGVLLVGAVLALWPARRREAVEQGTGLAVDRLGASEDTLTGEGGQR
jgi:cytochrome c-type biogenesis protein CcmF